MSFSCLGISLSSVLSLTRKLISGWWLCQILRRQTEDDPPLLSSLLLARKHKRILPRKSFDICHTPYENRVLYCHGRKSCTHLSDMLLILLSIKCIAQPATLVLIIDIYLGIPTVTHLQEESHFIQAHLFRGWPFDLFQSVGEAASNTNWDSPRLPLTPPRNTAWS